MTHAPEPSKSPVTSTKGSLRLVERRRSERLLLTVPIQAEGIDLHGQKFSEQTRTIIINRHGARIYLKQPVAAGALLLLSTKGGRHKATFRIVGPTRPHTPEGNEWGVECQEEQNIWGIGFPPPHSQEDACAALIECRRCHTVKLTPLSMVEHDVLGTSGLLVKECAACGRATSWSYKDVSAPFPGDDIINAISGQRDSSEQPGSADRRTQTRVAMHMPMRLRSFYGAEEFTRTENVSRTGVCFISDRNYEVGEVLLVTCPFEEGSQNIEVRGKLLRRHEMHGTGRKIYAVHYER